MARYDPDERWLVYQLEDLASVAFMLFMSIMAGVGIYTLVTSW